MKNFRDIEQLSAYLDGQLSPSDSARLESRISSDPEIASAFKDIRAARSILRKLPSRKAPRNFTLTRQMVGLKPPLPRSYSFFRFSTALATILLMLTFAANLILPNLFFGMRAAAPAPAAAQDAYGMGDGSGTASIAMAAATEAPAMAMEAAPMATLPATVTNADLVPTAEPLLLEAPMAKEAATAPEPPAQPQGSAERQALIPVTWQIGLLSIGVISLLIMLALRHSARQKWK
jgi:anti-sigma factor RsiW